MCMSFIVPGLQQHAARASFSIPIYRNVVHAFSERFAASVMPPPSPPSVCLMKPWNRVAVRVRLPQLPCIRQRAEILAAAIEFPHFHCCMPTMPPHPLPAATRSLPVCTDGRATNQDRDTVNMGASASWPPTTPSVSSPALKRLWPHQTRTVQVLGLLVVVRLDLLILCAVGALWGVGAVVGAVNVFPLL